MKEKVKKEKVKKEKTRSAGYIGIKKFWAWESRELSDAGFALLTGYIIFFCTDALKLNPLIVGSLFAASKIVDGITDVVVGYIVDRTNTKWGRGRPYDVCLIGAWLSLALIFFCPTGWSDGARLAWVVVWYTLATSVFYTFLNAGEGVFIIRAFNHDQIIKLSSQGSVATSLMGLICGMFIPQAVKSAGTDASAWMRMVVTFAIPLTLIGLCRMIFVKEENETVEVVKEKSKTEIKEIFSMMGKNKYWMMFCLVTLIGSTVANMGVSVYFFKVVFNDVGVQSLFAGASALAVVSLFILPKLLKKFHLSKIIMVGQLIAVVTSIIGFTFYRNLPILIICYVVSLFATLPANYAARMVLFDAAIYNEYLGFNRMEGSMNSLFGLMKRVGAALGTFLLGVALSAIGYDPDAVVETVQDGVVFGLRFMAYILPMLSALIQALIWYKYDLENT